MKKTIDLREDKTREGATFYMDIEGDVFDNLEESELLGVSAIIKRDSLYIGTYQDMLLSVKKAVKNLI